MSEKQKLEILVISGEAQGVPGRVLDEMRKVFHTCVVATAKSPLTEIRYPYHAVVTHNVTGDISVPEGTRVFVYVDGGAESSSLYIGREKICKFKKSLNLAGEAKWDQKEDANLYDGQPPLRPGLFATG